MQWVELNVYLKMRAMLGTLIEKGAHRHHLQAMVIGGWTPLLSRMSGYFKCIEPFLAQQGITIVQTVLGGTMNRKGWNVIFDVVTGALSEYEVCNNSTEYDLLSCHSKGNKESQPEGNEILAVNASFRRHQFWRACCSCVGNNRRGRANELRYEGPSEEKIVFTDLYGKKRVCTIDGFKKTNRALKIGIITENAFTPHENDPVNEREAPLQSDADNQNHGSVFQ
ncbi:hypothetical protein [Endozoicomonas sp. SCSIO W0465]|uniref:hypothetical protein n=1 Tax=Endozoicomonas sp. SCSIO W0465 TaxID=2918516 RepID=UPI0020762AEE|nr:hypothetical protein [Endozoicomonas sp. SCSIO W0465]USE38555.1 hypothetical protein MJO57_10500 [Endozoicomonas sp. SCSIO W0465]